ncbi:unnamed protein product [Periconia digitata]|uniref:Uncharacterized protein n=1 Tax=Periconia digitata TaxID=1303443 RepID=A0A9W4UNJ6_9PLEO|nr:unnamed protein product [Periconia digitata]
MGGRAFRSLNCPRISPDLYHKSRDKVTSVLQKLFDHVTVPTEMPEKPDFGDIDYLVSGYTGQPTDSTLDWSAMVSALKENLNTNYGKRGHYEPSIMYFAIPAGEIPQSSEDQVWIQVDVKVCEIPGLQNFEWSRLLLNYASGFKMLASFAKPLGLTINPDGMHIRVEEMEETNGPGSMVFVSMEPRDVLNMLGLDWRFLWAGLETREELYSYIVSSSEFHPKHTSERLKDEKYAEHHKDRSAAWIEFITEWIPRRYPDYSFPDKDIPLEQWYKENRVKIQQKVFTLFPHITAEYYTKRKEHLKEAEEKRLCEILMDAIPDWDKNHTANFSSPRVLIQCEAPCTSSISKTPADCELEVEPPTPPVTPPPPRVPSNTTLPALVSEGGIRVAPFDDLYLPRQPPTTFSFRPPPPDMSRPAKLACIARWTRFCEITGQLHLGGTPRDKAVVMSWSDSIMSDEILVKWVEKVWVVAWWRQSWVNYVGMWRRRFEKEDMKAALKMKESVVAV